MNSKDHLALADMVKDAKATHDVLVFTEMDDIEYSIRTLVAERDELYTRSTKIEHENDRLTAELTAANERVKELQQFEDRYRQMETALLETSQGASVIERQNKELRTRCAAYEPVIEAARRCGTYVPSWGGKYLDDLHMVLPAAANILPDQVNCPALFAALAALKENDDDG